VTRRAVKRMIASQNFNVGIANPGEPHAYERPVRTKPRKRFGA
jgi:hypothetical protein